MFRTGLFLSASALCLLVLSPALAVEKSKDANPSMSVSAPSSGKDKTPSKPQAPQTPPAKAEVSVDDLLDEADKYYDGNGVAQDYDRAFELYSQAAEQGDGYGLDMVGLMYDLGLSVKEDPKTAMEWYRKAADAGFYTAMVNMGTLYEEGRGVQKDYAEAVGWYRKAADQGNLRGQYYMGDMYLDGRGVEKDYEEAVSWYQKAVDGGYADAYWALSLRYVYGQGVAKDTYKAADLAYYALTHGVKAAKDNLRDARNKDVSRNFLRRVQELLAADGYYDGKVDGNFGPQTRDAIDAAFGTAN